jgi:predicted HD superfamily hydrolase involved in NAD metabolism
MDTWMQALAADIPVTGSVAEDVPRFLVAHGCAATATHCRAVAAEARRLARRFGVDAASAGVAGWLHDVSAVIPNADRLRYAARWGVPVLDEERALPMILHQKLSAVMGPALFGVGPCRGDPAVLAAVRCHTTLRAGAAPLDKVLFLADKIAWDQPGAPPYLDALKAALATSLDAGVCVYLSHLWAQRATLPVVHPWFRAAYHELCCDEDPKGFR